MAHTPLILAQFDGDATYADGGAGGTGTEAGAVRYRTGHDVAVMAALVEEGTVNKIRNPSAELGSNYAATWSYINDSPAVWSTDQASDGTKSGKITTGTSGDQGFINPANAVTPVSASSGQTWTHSTDIYGTGSNDIYLDLREYASGLELAHPDTPVTPPVGWTRYEQTVTLSDPQTTRVRSAILTANPEAVTFHIDRVQLEHKDHATTYCPEFEADGTTLKTGYTVASSAEGVEYTRAAASVSIPTAAPDWVACRYSEDLGDTWAFAYTETLTGNNIGSYGQISHDGSNLVIESERALLIGPLYAGTGSLDAGEQSALDAEATWTFGMSLAGSDAPVVDAGAATGSASTGQAWTRSGSFTDADSAGPWAATVDYGEGAGPQALALSGTTFALSHTYSTAGEYTVTVEVDDNEGGVGSDTVIVTVSEIVPPDFSQTADIFLIETARPGATGGNVATVDWTTIRSDVDALLLLPQITELGSIPNVDETGVADGHVLVRSGDDYVTQELVAPAWGAITGTLADQLDLNTALGGKAGTSHSHTTPSLVRATFGQGGYMSSGSRSLASTPVTLADGIEYLVVATLNMQMRGADPGACYYRLAVVIDGNTRQSAGGSSGFWCVQGVPDKTTWVHHRTLTGTGSAITVSASVAYHSGGGFYTDAGELEVRLFPAR